MNNISGYDAIAASVGALHDRYIESVNDLAAQVYEEFIEEFLAEWGVDVRVSSVEGYHEWYLYFPHCGYPVDSLMETFDQLPDDLNGYVKFQLVEHLLPILHIEIDGGDYYDLGDYVFRHHLDKLDKPSLKS